MDKRTKRRKKKNSVQETLELVKAILLVVIAVAAVAFVFVFIKKELSEGGTGKGGASVFGALFGEKETETETETETVSVEESTEAPVTEGLHTDDDGNVMFSVNGQDIRNAWADIDNGLYFFDGDGHAKTGTFSEGAIVYEAGDDGSVRNISYDFNYRAPYNSDYEGLVKDKTVWAYLGESSLMGRFRTIMYKKTTDTMSHILGGTENAQYTMPGSIMINDGYIYWLPMAEDPDEMEALISGNLYRMRPGTEKREIGAKDVEGFKVLNDQNGNAVIYYFQGGNMHKCTPEDFREDDSGIIFSEDMEYTVKSSDDGKKLYLVTKSGYPVRKQSDSFRAGDFTDSIKSDGEIISVEPQTSVAHDNYEYSVETGEIFGSVRSVIVRTGSDNVKTVISGEFIGECRSLYYCEAENCMYGEFLYGTEGPRIMRISMDGDVDILKQHSSEAAAMKIYAYFDDSVVVKIVRFDGSSYFGKLDRSSSSPLAAAVEPFSFESFTQPETEPESESENVNPGLGPGFEKQEPSNVYYSPGVGPSQGGKEEVGPGMQPSGENVGNGPGI